jgi:hypothetical protein
MLPVRIRPRLDDNNDKDQLVLYDQSYESPNKDAIVIFGRLSLPWPITSEPRSID